MADASNFESQKIALAASLNAVANSMRNCATLAENFASIVKQSSFTAGSPAARTIESMAEHLHHAEHALNGVAPDAYGEVAVTKKGKRKADADDVPEGGKRRRQTKPKDPNAPKRPASSYIIFQNEIRKDIKAKYPTITNSDLLQMIAKQWAEMSEEDKNVYTQAMTSAKEQYSIEKKRYDERSPEEVAAANAATAAALAEKKATPRTRTPKEKAVPAAAPKAAKAAVPIATNVPAVASMTSANTESDEDSGSEESDSPQAHDDDQESDESDDSIIEEEKPAKRAKTSAVTLAPVTPAAKEKKRKTHKA